MAFDLVSTALGLVTTIVVMAIFVVPALWLSGKLLAGKNNAKFTDAIWIVMLGAAVMYLFNSFIADLITGAVLTLLTYLVLLTIWLGLVKHFFDCGWLKAFAISVIAIIIAIIILVVVGFVLAFFDVAAGWLPIPTQFPSL
jgi:hypothetical protein